VAFSVTVTQIREDGSEAPVDGELAAALAGPAGQFSSMVAWTAQGAGRLDHGEREKVIAESGRELQRRLLEATFAVDSAREHGLQFIEAGRRSRPVAVAIPGKPASAVQPHAEPVQGSERNQAGSQTGDGYESSGHRS
jgi:hypothetical protein